MPPVWPRPAQAWHDGPVGPAIIVIVLVVAIPVGVLVSGGVMAAVLGTFLGKDADARYEGTEYVEIGRSA